MGTQASFIVNLQSVLVTPLLCQICKCNPHILTQLVRRYSFTHTQGIPRLYLIGLFLEDTCPFSGAIDTPVLDFW